MFHHRINSAIRSLLLALLFVAISSGFSQENRENGDFKLAVGLYNDGMFDLAVEQLKNFVSTYPSTSQGIEARFYLGSAQMKLKRYEDARVTFQNFALTYTDHAKAPEAWMLVGDAYAALDNRQEAASSYERLKVFHPRSSLVPEALMKAAEQYRVLGSNDNAKRVLRSIVQDYPSSSSVLPARVALSMIYAAEGNADLAEREARHVIRSDAPATVRAASLLVLGTLQENSCLFDDATVSYSTVVKEYATTPSAIPAAVALGTLEAREGTTDAAVRNFNNVASNERAADSLRAKALMLMGTMYDRRKDFANAQATFEKLIGRFPRSAYADRATLFAGRSALQLRHGNEALGFAERLIATRSADCLKEALILAAEASDARNEYADAAEFYVKYLRSFPNDPFEADVMIRLGDCYRERLAEYRSAITIYDEFRQRFPRHERVAEIAYNISLCQEALNDINGAITTCGELQKRFPAYMEKRILEERIESLTSKTISNREQSVRELAALLGELLTNNSRAEISFSLANFYFHTLKDYRSATVYYGLAIDSGVSKEHFIDAYYFRARSFHLMSDADSIRDRAILYYESFLKLYPGSQWSDDARYYSFLLRSEKDSRSATIEEMKAFLASNPTSTHIDELTFALGSRAYKEKDYRGALGFLANNISRLSSGKVAGNSEKQGTLTGSFLVSGKSYIALRQLDSAALNLRRMRQMKGTDANVAEAESDLAEAYLQSQLFDSAIIHAENLLSEFFYSPFARTARKNLGNIYLASGRPGDAIAFFAEREAEEHASPFMKSDTLETPFYLASAYARNGEMEKARRYYTAYLRDNEKHTFSAQAYSALGVFARTSGNADRASAYFKKAASLGASDDTQSLLLADQLFQSGQFEESAKYYRQLSQSATSDQTRRGYVFGAIISYLRADRLSEADKLLAANKALFEKDENSKAEFTYEKGNYYYRSKDYATAKKMFDIVADNYEKTRFGPWGHYYLGKILEVSGKLKDAAKKYDEVIEEFPRSDVLPRVFLSLGNMHFNAERFEEAIRFFRRIVETVDSSNEVLPYALNNLIEAYESTKLYDAAIKATRQYIETYPRDEHLTDKRIKLGTLFTKAGYYDQAIDNFQQILNDGESAIEAELRYDIGEANYYKGDYQQAILEFLKVPYLVTTRGKVDWVATSLYMAGQSYEKISKFDEAINMYRQIIDRPGIDATFKAGARKEIDRVKQLTKKGSQ